ncbi:het-domain-containing protein [Fusarium heterosporum]|uniref:Het-domain-containing protein n=1 Tax=Fusarium heterosporum TaxID=42747 RepID=A0A8H5SXT5_FUSHE|nr:het-domain-containing protein [Fusarium heterosporum]
MCIKEFKKCYALAVSLLEFEPSIVWHQQSDRPDMTEQIVSMFLGDMCPNSACPISPNLYKNGSMQLMCTTWHSHAKGDDYWYDVPSRSTGHTWKDPVLSILHITYEPYILKHSESIIYSIAMTTFNYPALDLSKDNIRLLLVEKGAPPSDVFCSLFEATTSPDEGTPYKALSYTWGAVEYHDDTRPHLPEIFVNDVKFEATDNLRMALSRIRNSECDEVLWIDAICINQKDDREKGHQVKQMGEIYKNAEEVLIWLGPSNEAIRDLFELVTLVDENARDISTPVRHREWTRHCRDHLLHHYKSAKTPQNIGAMKQLMSRRWFRRIWILQEVAMARTARIVCGSSSCPARTFSLMPSLLDIPTTAHVQAVLDLMPRIRGNTWWASDRSLHNLLIKFAGSEAKDERDMVYALLSISQDACDPARLYPSYEQEISQVYRETALFLVFGRRQQLSGRLVRIDIMHLSLPLEKLAAKLVEQNTRQYFKFRLLPESSIGGSYQGFIEHLSRTNINLVEMLKELSKLFGIPLTVSSSTRSDIENPQLLTVRKTEEHYEFRARIIEKPEEVSVLILTERIAEEWKFYSLSYVMS